MKAKYLGCLIFFLFLSIVEYYGQTFSKVTSSLNFVAPSRPIKPHALSEEEINNAKELPEDGNDE